MHTHGNTPIPHLPSPHGNIHNLLDVFYIFYITCASFHPNLPSDLCTLPRSYIQLISQIKDKQLPSYKMNFHQIPQVMHIHVDKPLTSDHLSQDHLLHFWDDLKTVYCIFQLGCCGINSYRDWFSSPWEQEQSDPNTVPQSCCRGDAKTCPNSNLPVQANATHLPVFTHVCLAWEVGEGGMQGGRLCSAILTALVSSSTMQLVLSILFRQAHNYIHWLELTTGSLGHRLTYYLMAVTSWSHQSVIYTMLCFTASSLHSV